MSEELLKQIISKLDNLEKGQVELRVGQSNLEKSQDELRQGQRTLEKVQEELRLGQIGLVKVQEELRLGQEGLVKGQEELKGELTDLRADLNEFKQDVEYKLDLIVNKLIKSEVELSKVNDLSAKVAEHEAIFSSLKKAFSD